MGNFKNKFKKIKKKKKKKKIQIKKKKKKKIIKTMTWAIGSHRRELCHNGLANVASSGGPVGGRVPTKVC